MYLCGQMRLLPLVGLAHEMVAIEAAACADTRADNFDAAATGTASSNQECSYSSAGLARSLGLGKVQACYIDGGNSSQWPPPFSPSNGTHTARGGPGATTVVQGRAATGVGGVQYATLASRVDATGAASLVLRHVEISGHAAISQPDCYRGFACGGAVFVSGGGNLTVEYALFAGNTALQGRDGGADGGAIKVVAGSVSLRGVMFIANQATFGGAVNMQGCSTMEVTRCVFSSNHALHGGGGLRVNLGGPGAFSDSRMDIRESEFSHNSAVKEGGAFDLIMGGHNVEVVSVVDCRGMGNIASSAAAVYQQNQRQKTRLSLSEADVLLQHASQTDERWAFLSFRTALARPPMLSGSVSASCVAQLSKDGCTGQTRQLCLGCAKTHSADLHLANCTTQDAVKLCKHEGALLSQAGHDLAEACEVPLLLLVNAVAGSCHHGAAGIPPGSTCTPAVCTTANLGPGTAVTCNDGVLLWQGGCACGPKQHDASNTSLPDTGVCAGTRNPACFAKLLQLCPNRSSKTDCLACCSEHASALHQAGCAQQDFDQDCPTELSGGD